MLKLKLPLSGGLCGLLRNGRLLFCLIAGIIFLTVPLLQAQTYTTTGGGFVGYVAPGYLIDSDRSQDELDGILYNDPDYNRWYLRVRAFGWVTNSQAGEFHWLRMAFSLVDVSTGNLVDLQIPSSGTGAVTRTFSDPIIIEGNDVQEFTANMVVHPNVRLDPNKTYRVRAQLQKLISLFPVVWEDVGSPNNTATARSFIHFKGPWGTDTARNVVIRGNTNTLTRTYAVQGVAGQTHFTAAVNFDLWRYDEPHTAVVGSDSISVRYTVELFDVAAPSTRSRCRTLNFRKVFRSTVGQLRGE